MPSLNQVTLIGHVGKDPEIRYTQGGEPIASFSLATSENWTDKSGQKQEKTQWHNVSVFGKVAQVVRDYVTKGKLVYVQGQVNYDEWADKDGTKRKATKIVVGSFGGKLVLLGGKGDSAPRGSFEQPELPEDKFVATDQDVPF
jgi:single-strand DNA-binding protein